VNEPHRFDPYHPMRLQIAALDDLRLSGDAGYMATTRTLPRPMCRFYQDFCRRPDHAGEPPNFGVFLKYIQELNDAFPSADELDPAPELCAWSLLRRPITSLCSLTGYAVGHPNFDWGTPVVTSTVFRIDPKMKWARTWSRFYLLAEHDPTTFGRMQRAGLINPDVEQIAFD
jgi:hypothetical protein